MQYTFFHRTPGYGNASITPATRVWLCLALLMAMGGWPLRQVRASEDAGVSEYRVKAAFVQRFAAYVEWPEAAFARPNAPIVVAVTGAESFANELTQTSSNRPVNGRLLEIRRLKPGESLAGVHILFVGSAEYARLPQWLSANSPRPVLTVTESDGALNQGSIINFVMIDRRVRFEIALDTATKRGLKLSSRLLAVAQDVRMESK